MKREIPIKYNGAVTYVKTLESPFSRILKTDEFNVKNSGVVYNGDNSYVEEEKKNHRR